ncbi:shikimate dehydrogenase [soil metagenome]
MIPLMIPSPQGKTRLFAVLGYPVGQVLAPVMMNRLFVESDSDAVMVPIEVTPENVPAVIAGLKGIANCDGMLVTIPHKFAVCDHADSMSTGVRLSGASNALRREPDGRWSADNFDGAGFVAGLRQYGHDPRGKRVSLVGTGGAGVAIASSLVEAGVSRLSLFDLSADKVQQLADRLNAHRADSVEVCAAPKLEDIDIVVNATPMGLRDKDPLPFDVSALADGVVVADIIMKPHDTKLLKAAAARGLAVHHGIHMLAPQIEMYRKFFRISAAKVKSA